MLAPKLFCARKSFCTTARTSQPPVDWFPENVALVNKRANRIAPHFVFLEGGPGSNKVPVLGRLSKIGYTTGNVGFVQLLKESNGDINIASKVFQTKLENFVGTKLEEFDKGIIPKENIIVFNRSLLSCVHISPNEARSILENICKDNFSIILCNIDMIARKQRLGLAMFESDPQEQSLRVTLGEDDDTALENTLDKYQKYFNAGLIDHQLFTTSSRQGAMAILHSFGIKASLPNIRASYTNT